MFTAAVVRTATVAFFCAAGFTAIGIAPAAVAAPQCTDVAPNTRMCRTPGHTQITTSPDQSMTNPYPGWGYGGLGGIGIGGFGIGGGGIWFGGF